MPNHREWALLFGVVIVLITLVRVRGTRSGLPSLLRSALHLKLLAAIIGLGTCVAVEVWVGSRMSIWTPDLLTGTLFWFAGSAIVLFFKFDDVAESPHYFRRTARSVVTFSVIIGAYLNLFTLNFVAEAALQGALALLIGIVVVSRDDEQVKKFAEAVIALIAGSLALYVLVEFVVRWNSVATMDTVRHVVLPMWLTVGVLPYIYFTAILAAYGQLLLRLRCALGPAWDIGYSRKLALLVLLRAS